MRGGASCVHGRFHSHDAMRKGELRLRGASGEEGSVRGYGLPECWWCGRAVGLVGGRSLGWVLGSEGAHLPCSSPLITEGVWEGLFERARGALAGVWCGLRCRKSGCWEYEIASSSFMRRDQMNC